MTGLQIRGGNTAASDPLDCWIVDGTLTTTVEADATVDASGLTVVPGFVDLQTNGAYGHDFTDDPDSMWQAGARLPEQGVTSFCPTIITSPPERLESARRAIAKRPDAYLGAEPLGLHVEGPYISESRRGTHPPQYLSASVPERFDTTNVAIVTVAPELPGAVDFITGLANAGVTVSLGHSAADAETAIRGVDAGATFGTHLFNAMEPLSARDPGLAGVLLTDQRCFFGVIADGVHLAPQMLRLAWAASAESLVLVTDSIAAAGMPEGRYELGPVPVEVIDGEVHNTAGDLAGSVLSMDRAIKELTSITGAPIHTTIPSATSRPAQVVNRSDLGTLDVGTKGDVVLLDGFEVVATIVGGQVAYCSEPARLNGVNYVPQI